MPKLGSKTLLDHNFNERTPLLVSTQPKKRSSGLIGTKRRKSSRSPHHGSSGRSSPAGSMFGDIGGGIDYSGEMYYPEMVQARSPGAYQRKGRRGRSPSPAGGWSDGTDSEDDFRKNPWKRPEAAETQSYLVIAMVVAVLAVLAALKGYHIYHGTEEREENRPKGGYY